MNVCLEKVTWGNKRHFEFEKGDISLNGFTFGLTGPGVREISCRNHLSGDQEGNVCGRRKELEVK
jgi:hypothetical protein